MNIWLNPKYSLKMGVHAGKVLVLNNNIQRKEVI